MLADMRGTSASINARELQLDELQAHAETHESSNTRGEARENSARYELFRRAISEGDEGAWQVITQLYRRFLTAQARRRLVRGAIVQDGSYYVDRAFERFWRGTRGGRFAQFPDLASILKYLTLCLASEVIDQARARQRHAWVPLDDEICAMRHVAEDPADQVVRRLARRELWQTINHELADDDERTVARLSFVGGLSPREILARHPDRFQSATDVYRTKRNMIERLRRSPEVRRLLGTVAAS